jgi:hypothetical protein
MFKNLLKILVRSPVIPLSICAIAGINISQAAIAQTTPGTSPNSVATELNLDKDIIEGSPVLRRWLADPPDVLYDIYNSPSFNSKLKLGFTSRDNSLGFEVGVDDVFLGKSPLTISAGYQREFTGKEDNFEANVRYYLLPLGSYFNVAPQVGYRSINIVDLGNVSGLDLGLQGILVLSPHSSDLRLSQTFTAIGSNTEASITTLSASYAITRKLRLGSNIQWRRSPIRYDSRVGFVLELAL